jgi:hypothetical protein
MQSSKSITEKEFRTRLNRGEWGLPPLRVEDVQTRDRTKDSEPNARITLNWRGTKYRFGAEVRRLWTAKVVTEAADRAVQIASKRRLSPLVIAPYLSEERLRELEARGVSGIDLCGNGVVVVPGKLLVFRSGSPNRYRGEGAIKNVYRGASSLVARTFLVVPEFPSVGELLNRIRALGGDVTLSTVSKVCKSLEQDLVIERMRGDAPRSRSLRLLQAEKLLALLRGNYVPPNVTQSVTAKFGGSTETFTKRLLAWESKAKQNIVLTGESSVDAYAIMARGAVSTYYCSDVSGLVKSLGEDLSQTDRFANVKFLETQDGFVYFDRRPGLAASPLQTYLELATGEGRERETAEQVRRLILSQLVAIAATG